MQIPDRLLNRVVITETCWLWPGATKVGYAWGLVKYKPELLHRFFYRELREPIPEGLHIDHLCRVRNCLNPWHMEAVTQKENTLRGDAPTIRAKRDNLCVRGLHSMDNAYVNPKTGWRRCRSCAAEYERRRRAIR